MSEKQGGDKPVVVEHEFGTDVCFHEKLPGGKVKCLACSHHCVLEEGSSGICAIRKNDNGVLRLVIYGHAMCVNARDHIEKKPLYHVMPGSYTMSMASVGCNFGCEFCQNWDLSQCSKEIKKKAQEQKDPSLMDIELTSMGYRLSPQELIHYAKKNHCKIIAFTYNEPTIFLEYAMDVATLAKKEGMKCIFKSNGFESAYTLEKLAPLIDAFNIDLKSFNDSFYQKICHSRLQPVLDCIRTLHEKGIWVEVTTLLINGLNDSDEELEKIAKFIYDISPDIPWHITPFRPEYKMQDKERTPSSSLHRGYVIAKKVGLRYVYARSGEEQNTRCPCCGALLVVRRGLEGASDGFRGACTACGTGIPGIWV